MSRFLFSLGCLFLISLSASGQDSVLARSQNIPADSQKYIWFPHPLNAKSRVSIGFILTTMPNEITEEMHFRVPAGDLHLVKKITGKVDMEARLLFQVIQNMLMLGPHWRTDLSDRVSLRVGNDLGFWFGRIKVQQVDTRGSGFQNFPNVSLGFRFNKQILLTLKAEQIMTFGVKTRAGKTDVASDYRLFSGSAYTLVVEQPFAGKKNVSLGFRALYTDYYWQTWTLFENYDRNLFFPQFIVGVIL